MLRLDTRAKRLRRRPGRPLRPKRLRRRPGRRSVCGVARVVARRSAQRTRLATRQARSEQRVALVPSEHSPSSTRPRSISTCASPSAAGKRSRPRGVGPKTRSPLSSQREVATGVEEAARLALEEWRLRFEARVAPRHEHHLRSPMRAARPEDVDASVLAAHEPALDALDGERPAARRARPGARWRGRTSPAAEARGGWRRRRSP